MEQVEIANGNGQGNGRLPENTEPAKSAFQRRIDKLTREKYELQADLQRALGIIERYKQALRAARSANHG